MATIAALCIAGGQGRRFGDPGKCRHTLPRLIALAQAAGCARVVVCGDHDWLAALPGCVHARDAATGCGPLAGIVGGLAQCAGCDAALVLPGDTIDLRLRLVRRIIASWRRDRRAAMGMERSARPRSPARSGLLGILPAADWGLARALLDERRLGVHRLWRAARARPVWVQAADVADLDHPGDLLKYRAGRRPVRAVRGKPDAG